MSAESIPKPNGIPTIVTSTSTARIGPTMPISAPHPTVGQNLRPAAAVASAARGNSSTNRNPSKATESVTAIHR